MVVWFGHPKRVFSYFCPPIYGGCGSVTRVEIFQGVYRRPFTCPKCGKTITMNVELPLPDATLLPRHTVHAFGDESTYGDVIAYGVVAVHAHNRLEAEQFLSELKRHYSVDPQAEFHCRIVFSGHQRQKSPWKNLSVNQIFDFAQELLSGFVRLPMVFSVGAQRIVASSQKSCPNRASSLPLR